MRAGGIEPERRGQLPLDGARARSARPLGRRVAAIAHQLGSRSASDELADGLHALVGALARWRVTSMTVPFEPQRRSTPITLLRVRRLTPVRELDLARVLRRELDELRRRPRVEAELVDDGELRGCAVAHRAPRPAQAARRSVVRARGSARFAAPDVAMDHGDSIFGVARAAPATATRAPGEARRARSRRTGEHDAAMHAAGAAERDGQVALSLALVLRERRTRAGCSVFSRNSLRLGAGRGRSRARAGRCPGSALELGNEVRVLEEADVEARGRRRRARRT